MENAPADEKDGMCQGMTKMLLGKHDRVRCVNSDCLNLYEWRFLIEDMYSLLSSVLKKTQSKQ